jgi:hypothetical protein
LATQKHRPNAPGRKRSGRPYNSAKQRKKMLASTVQFSTNNQTTGRHSTARPRTPRRASGTTDNRPCRDNTHPRGAARSLRTQQRAYGPDRPGPPRSPPPRTGAVLAATGETGRTGQRSTLEHHPEHSAATR